MMAIGRLRGQTLGMKRRIGSIDPRLLSAVLLTIIACKGGCAEGGGGRDTNTVSTPQAVLPVLAVPPATETWYVSSSLGDDGWSGRLPAPNASRSDGPKASLEAALMLLDGARPGSHVLLRRGDTWRPDDEAEIDDAEGTETNPIVLGAYGSGARPRIEARHDRNVFIVRGNASGATRHFWLRDLHLAPSSTAQASVGVFVGESLHANAPSHVTLSSLRIESLGGGIVVYGDRHLIHGCRIADNLQGHGAFVSGRDIVIAHNEFEHNGPPPPDLFFHSLYLSSPVRMVFEHNLVHSATDGVKVRTPVGSVFRHNTIHDNVFIGIHLGGDSTAGAYDNRIESNRFYRNGSDIVIKSESGVQIDPVDGLVIANNVMDRGTNAPIDYGAHLTVTPVPARNVAVVNNLVVSEGDDDGIRIANDGGGLTCENNVVAQLSGGTAFDLDPAVEERRNLAITTRAAFDDLALADPARFDYAPTSDSVALIDQGADVSSLLETDFTGAARLRGASFDIGPYEYER